MQLHGQIFFPWHGVRESIQAIQDHYLGSVFIYGPMHSIHEFAGREFGNVDLVKKKTPVIQERLSVEPQAFQPQQIRLGTLIEQVDGR